MANASEVQQREYMTDGLGRLMEKGTPAQIRRVGEKLSWQDYERRPCALLAVAWEPFDLPAGYVQLWFTDGFTCGISPDGDLSS